MSDTQTPDAKSVVNCIYRLPISLKARLLVFYLYGAHPNTPPINDLAIAIAEPPSSVAACLGEIAVAGLLTGDPSSYSFHPEKLAKSNPSALATASNAPLKLPTTQKEPLFDLFKEFGDLKQRYTNKREKPPQNGIASIRQAMKAVGQPAVVKSLMKTYWTQRLDLKYAKDRDAYSGFASYAAYCAKAGIK